MTTLELKAEKDFAAELRSETIAIELNLPTIGRHRRMDERHQCEVADHFGAKRKAVGGNKGLYAPNQPEIKKISSALGAARAAWLSLTIAYRPGIRLLRKERLQDWIAAFEKCQKELSEALAEADANYNEILAASREFLGEKLFNFNDYPTKFSGWLHIRWSVHNFEPSDQLLQLAPETYKREQERVRKQFEGAIAAYEQESREQLQKLVGALVDKLGDAKTGVTKDGKKVKFTEAATSNLREFFERFKSLNIRSDQALADLVDTAEQALGSTTMLDVKKSADKRDALAASFDAVAKKLDQLVIDAPSRSIDLDDLD